MSTFIRKPHPTNLSRLESRRLDCVRRARLGVPGAWGEVAELDAEIRVLRGRVHEAMRPSEIRKRRRYVDR